MQGHYSWTYERGSFPVSLRANGVFRCSSYPAASTFSVTANQLDVDWKSFGSYTFTSNDGFANMEGFASGKPENWRKMEFIKPFSDEELCVLVLFV